MPIYEYICLECKEKIEIWATLSEKEKGLKVICPKCNSSKTTRIFGNISVIGGSKGKNKPPKCGPQGGPCCCSKLPNDR